MEKYSCKLCSRSFSNGRALGGHMRSHMMNLPLPPKPEPHRMAESSSSPSSISLQDRESETESSKNPTRRLSKRTRRINEKQIEDGPVSSISDTSPEENLAFCLMMLSADKWIRNRKLSNDEEEFEEGDESEEIEFGNNRRRGKHKCETCKRVFESYQALGGHKASHKKIKICNSNYEAEFEEENARKTHECSVCFRVFSSGQALGGHKRSHVGNENSKKEFGDNLIDLNLPAPIDDDDDGFSQIELSAVSDAEFVKSIR